MAVKTGGASTKPLHHVYLEGSIDNMRNLTNSLCEHHKTCRSTSPTRARSGSPRIIRHHNDLAKQSCKITSLGGGGGLLTLLHQEVESFYL
jgi:hypothetical protein